MVYITEVLNPLTFNPLAITNIQLINNPRNLSTIACWEVKRISYNVYFCKLLFVQAYGIGINYKI